MAIKQFTTGAIVSAAYGYTLVGFGDIQDLLTHIGVHPLDGGHEAAHAFLVKQFSWLDDDLRLWVESRIKEKPSNVNQEIIDSYIDLMAGHLNTKYGVSYLVDNSPGTKEDVQSVMARADFYTELFTIENREKLAMAAMEAMDMEELRRFVVVTLINKYINSTSQFAEDWVFYDMDNPEE